MVDELAKSIEQLRKLSPKLNAATDAATELVKLVEDFLNDECSIGIEAEVDVWSAPSGIDPEEYVGLSLAYRRFGGKFRVLVETCDEDSDANNGRGGIQRTALAWSSAPREMKLQAFPELPALLQEIAEQAEKAIKATTETTATVEKVVAAMKQE